MLRKLIAGLLSLVLVFACCGCGETTAQQVIPEDIFAEELATDELVVYTWGRGEFTEYSGEYWGDMLQTAGRMVQREKEGLELTIREIEYDSYDDILVVDMMAGTGPDVVLWENLRGDLLVDPVKSIESNMFLDLNPYFEQDPDFSFDDYTAAFDAGLYKEGRYYVPICSMIGTVAVSETKLQNQGIAWEPYCTYEAFSEKIEAHLDSIEPDDVLDYTEAYSWWRELYLYSSGLQLLDYETKTVLPDREGLYALTERCKTMWPYFTEGTVTEISKSVVGPWPFDLLMNQCTYLNQFYYLNSRTLPWHNETSEVDGTTQLAIGAMPSLHSEKPVAIPGISAAIRAGSPNKQNAYAFIKILLSKVCQSQLWLTAPVLKEQIAYHMEHDVEAKDRTEEGSDAAYAMFTDILPYQQFSTKQWEIYVQYMTPYWEGNASYEDCVADLESMLELYMYE